MKQKLSKEKLLRYANGEKQPALSKEPDLSKLTDNDLRAIAAMQKRLQSENLECIPGNLTENELIIYNSICSKL